MEELNDPYECDANRTPMYMTNDWKENYPKNYDFEVWELTKDNTFKCIRDYGERMEKGMMYGYYDEDLEVFHMLEKFKNKTRNDKVPAKILNKISKMYNVENSVKNCGYLYGYTEKDYSGKLYIYGEYTDDDYPRCW